MAKRIVEDGVQRVRRTAQGSVESLIALIVNSGLLVAAVMLGAHIGERLDTDGIMAGGTIGGVGTGLVLGGTMIAGRQSLRADIRGDSRRDMPMGEKLAYVAFVISMLSQIANGFGDDSNSNPILATTAAAALAPAVAFNAGRQTEYLLPGQLIKPATLASKEDLLEKTPVNTRDASLAAMINVGLIGSGMLALGALNASLLGVPALAVAGGLGAVQLLAGANDFAEEKAGKIQYLSGWGERLSWLSMVSGFAVVLAGACTANGMELPSLIQSVPDVFKGFNQGVELTIGDATAFGLALMVPSAAHKLGHNAAFLAQKPSPRL